MIIKLKTTATALYKPLIFVVIAVLVVALIYSSSSTFLVFGKKRVIEIDCYPQDGKTRCCGSEVDDSLHHIYDPGYTGVTYCTTCDNTSPPSNCTPREKIERQQPTTTTTTTNMCPDGSAPDANGNCPPVTQGPKGPPSTDQGKTLSPSTDVNKPSVKDNTNPLSLSTSQRVFSPTGGCVPGGTTCLPCDPGLPGANCIPSGDWHPSSNAPEGGGSEGSSGVSATTPSNVQPPTQGGSIEQSPSSSSDNLASNNNAPTPDHNKPKGSDLGQLVGGGGESASKKGSSSNNDNSLTPPACPDKGPIPPDCTLKPKF